ncbi:type II toxin-antitoxin system RelE family toxin [Agrobacterium sp. RAC06]|uniref:type II toxin-antitoxin system RelE family toxin n=1 Tax=Agrobacterium sp. RAC06 TaxID=1842536 RepID=UPI0008573445|nr:type II toxin-antitoxin system RelE/ParE family toxin [Agrobacterium sp. RAC06]AOG12497.1 plasmid stabilization system family protein [Agrobacterium sp. RAC06]MDZ7874245.1 type II toxin-antitoxin system RelE/ParE family toxin [Rhizobium sp.]
MRDVVYSKDAIRSLNRMPANEARRIRSKVLQYAADPASLANNVKKLRDSRYHRLRIGDWRVIFREDGTVVDVVRVAARGEAYEGEL